MTKLFYPEFATNARDGYGNNEWHMKRPGVTPGPVPQVEQDEIDTVEMCLICGRGVGKDCKCKEGRR